MAAAAATPTGLLCTSLTAQTIHGQEREMAEVCARVPHAPLDHDPL
jgi:hypothetical protein